MKTLELVVNRAAKRPKYTIGHLYIDGKFFCDTIEDTDRGLTQSMPLAEIVKKKVYGETAIPSGRYRIGMGKQSPTYAKKAEWLAFNNAEMPRIEDVKGWSGVLIHSGNDETHTLGCLIVGENKAVGKVLNSKATFKKLFAILLAAHKEGKEIWLTIK